MLHDSLMYVTCQGVMYVTCQGVMSILNESCHVWMSCVIHGHIWMIRFTVISRSKRLGSRPHKVCRIQSVLLQWHDSFICHMPHKVCRIQSVPHIMYATYNGVVSILNESCHIWMSHVAYEWVMSLQHLKPRDLGQSHAKYASSVLCVLCVVMTWLFHVWHDTFKCSIINWCAICGSTRLGSRQCKVCHVWMSHVACKWVMSHTNESRHIY